jgi:hypothetical protein
MLPMNRLSSMARHLLLAMLFMASTAAIPQTASRYTVEIVVFRNSGQTGALPVGPTAEAVPDDGSEMTPSTSRKLASAAAKLKANGMKILAHTAWTQAPVGCANTNCRNTNQLRGVSAEQLGLTRSGISGKAGLQRGSSALFLGMDLTIDEGGRRYRIREIRGLEVRQLKAEEPQYFDHPAIGVLAVVTPVTQ